MNERTDRTRSPQHPGWLGLQLAGVLFVLLGIYVGAYYFCVAPVHFTPTGPAVPVYVEGINHDGKAYYGQRFTIVFAPVHEIDRRLRPMTWGE